MFDSFYKPKQPDRNSKQKMGRVVKVKVGQVSGNISF